MQRIPRLSIPAAPLTKASSSPAPRNRLQSRPLSLHDLSITPVEMCAAQLALATFPLLALNAHLSV